MTQAALKSGSTQQDSLALQYRREQVAREMASVYSAFAAFVTNPPKSGSQLRPSDSALSQRPKR